MRLTVRREFLKEALEFGIPLIPHSLSLFILAMGDRYFISLVLNFEDLGTYVLAMQLAALFGIFFNAFHNAFTPWLYQHLSENVSSVKLNIVRFTYMYFIIFFVLGIIACSFAPFIINLAAGPEYASAETIFPWLVFSQIFIGYYMMMVGYILFEKKTYILSAVTVISAIINVILIWILIKSFGLIGVAYASLTAMVIRFILVWFVSARIHEMPWIAGLKFDGSK